MRKEKKILLLEDRRRISELYADGEQVIDIASKIGVNRCTIYRELLRGYMKYQRRLKRTCSTALLILDDFLLHTITDEREVNILFEILEKRSEINLSTIICSQREPSSWSAMILNDEAAANAILKRATRHYTVVIKQTSPD